MSPASKKKTPVKGCFFIFFIKILLYTSVKTDLLKVFLTVVHVILLIL